MVSGASGIAPDGKPWIIWPEDAQIMRIELLDDDGKSEGRNFAVWAFNPEYQDSIGQVRGMIICSHEQAIEIIRSLWKMLPTDKRPCP